MITIPLTDNIEKSQSVGHRNVTPTDLAGPHVTQCKTGYPECNIKLGKRNLSCLKMGDGTGQTHIHCVFQRMLEDKSSTPGIFLSHSSIDGSAANQCGSNNHVVSLSLRPRMKEIKSHFCSAPSNETFT